MTILNTTPASSDKTVEALGNIDILNNLETKKALIVTGARASTSYGETSTRLLLEDLPKDVTLLCGGGYGIETTVIQTALRNGNPLIIVQAGGLGRLYPAGNKDLYEKALLSGNTVIISTEPTDVAPTRQRFLDQKKLLVDLVAGYQHSGVLIVETGFRSGVSMLVDYAVSKQIPVGAVPGAITSATSAGTNKLISSNKAVLVDAPEATVSLLGIN